MKKIIAKKLCIVILTMMMITLLLNYFLQIGNAKKNMVQSAQLKINQIEQILEQNNENVEELKSSLKEEYIIKARAAAYIVQNRPEIIGNQEEMEKIVELLQVDEFHLFDKAGRLYAGSEPKYFGYTFYSGTQMKFFLPMLEDNTLTMCQEMTNNTAESKLMQYTAVWREDKEGIVQIGMEPIRLLKAMEKNELPYIFSMVIPDSETVIYVIDKDGTVLGSTDQSLTGRDAEDLGLCMSGAVSGKKGFASTIQDVPSYCVFKDTGSLYIGLSQSKSSLFGSISWSMLLVFIYLGVTSLIMIFAILKHIDRYIITGIDVIIRKLVKITSGNLDTSVEVSTTPEFIKLSGHINQMVSSLLSTTSKLSKIFDTVDVMAGVYEYNGDMKRVLATNKVKKILMLTEEECEMLLKDKEIFEERISEISSNPVLPYKDIYQLPTAKESYVKIQAFTSGSNTLGIITDVTEEIQEKRRLKHEAEYDLLTELYTRRAFYEKVGQLYNHQEQLKQAVLIMLDIDNLKYINDNYGHANGDKAIQAAAGILKQCPAERRLLVRLSGDEFAVFLYGCDTREELQGYVDQLYHEMQKKTVIFNEQTEFPVSLSAGYVFYPEYNISFSALLKLADQAMYQSKKKGKGIFLPYSPDTEKISIKNEI